MMWILANETRTRAISESFGSSRFEGGPPWQALVIGLVLMALVLVIARGWGMMRRSAERSRPIGLFLQVAEALGINWQDRWLLMRIARQQKLPSALTLLLSKSTMLIHAQGYAASFGERRRERVLQQVAHIASLVFESNPARS